MIREYPDKQETALERVSPVLRLFNAILILVGGFFFGAATFYFAAFKVPSFKCLAPLLLAGTYAGTLDYFLWGKLSGNPIRFVIYFATAFTAGAVYISMYLPPW